MKSSDFYLAISGSFGAMDIGDEAMLTEDLHYAIEHVGIPRENISLFGWQPDYIAEYHHHPRQNCFPTSALEECANHDRSQTIGGRKPVKSILGRKSAPQDGSQLRAVLDRSHALLVTGGGTINTRDSRGDSVRRMHAIVSHFAASQTPIFMSGQTIGPLGEVAEHDRLAKEIVERVDCLTVRDSLYSKRYLDIIDSQPQELIETFDDAYTLPYQHLSLPKDVEYFVEDGNSISLNVTAYTSDTIDQRNFVARVGARLVEQYDTKLVLVSHTPLDFSRLWMIYDSLPNPLKSRVLVPDTRQWRDAMLKKLISYSRIAVGGRYHFIVFAGTSDTPFVGMSGNHYSYIKQDGFARPLDLQDSILTESETWDFDCVMERIKRNIDKELGLQNRFSRPSVSMRRFGEWLHEKFDLPLDAIAPAQDESKITPSV